MIATQTTTAVKKVNVTVTPYCCVDAGLNLGIPCSTIANETYPPALLLENRIETDPSFIAAEEGHYFSYYGGPGRGFVNSPGAYNGTTVGFTFYYATDALYTDGCGEVENFVFYFNVNVPLTETGYNMSAIQIIPYNSSEITVSCTTVLTSSQNTTSTITGTKDSNSSSSLK